MYNFSKNDLKNIIFRKTVPNATTTESRDLCCRLLLIHK